MKTELLAKLNENCNELLSLSVGLADEQVTVTPVVGEWTIKDVVGHVAFWDQVLLDHVRESYTQGRPHPQRDDEMDDIANPREAAKRKAWSWQRVRAEFENARRAVIERVESLSEVDLSVQVPSPWRGDNRFYSVAQMIEEVAIGHSQEHIEQIKNWKTKLNQPS